MTHRLSTWRTAGLVAELPGHRIVFRQEWTEAEPWDVGDPVVLTTAEGTQMAGSVLDFDGTYVDVALVTT